MKRNGLSNFGKGSPKEHTCVIIFKIHPLVKEKKFFKGFSFFLALAAILLNGAEQSEQF